MSQPVKFKITQFQWFEMQTKVRQIIQQVLGPIQKRILQSSALINKLKGNQAQDQQRIQQISLMIANDPKVFQTGVFSQVDRKFMQHAKLIQQLSRQIQQQNKYVQNKFKILDLRMQQSSQVLKNIASLKERVTKQMQLQNDNINSLRQNIQKMIADVNEDIRKTRMTITENHSQAERRDFVNQEQIRKVKQNILTIEDNVQLQRDMHSEKTAQLEDHQHILQRNCEDIKDLIDNKHLTKRLGDLVQDMDSQMKKILFKIDCINPLITQAQISQCLQAILPSKQRSKITIYQHKKYSQLNRQVLQRDYRNVQVKFNGLQLLEARQKKSMRQIIQLKRKKLLQMGIDIDHASYQQRQRYYNQVSLQDQYSMQMEQTKVAQKIDQQQMKRILSRLMQQYTQQFQHRIKSQIDDNKKYIYAVEEEIRHEVQQFQSLMNAIKTQCTTFHTQHVLQEKRVKNDIRENQLSIKSLQHKLLQYQDLQRLIYNFCSLMNHLSIQDEIDKQNISLLGTKQTPMDQTAQQLKDQRNSVVALDGKCFSCNGYPATTLTAFKMACLAYNPSMIRIDAKEYKREELLEFTTNMLQTIKKHIQAPNNVNNNSNQGGKYDDEKGQQHMNVYKSRSQSREASPAQRIKTLNSNHYDLQEKDSFKNSFISKHLQTDLSANEPINQESAVKFRKKTLNTTFSSSQTKRKHSLKKALLHEEMLKTNLIFSSLKKKNQAMLN